MSKKVINVRQLTPKEEKSFLEIFGYETKNRLIYNANDGELVVDRYGNALAVDNIALVPNPKGKGYILIDGGRDTISDYLSELDGEVI